LGEDFIITAIKLAISVVGFTLSSISDANEEIKEFYKVSLGVK